MKHSRDPEANPHTHKKKINLSQKETRIYKGKTVSSINNAGKIGDPHQKMKIWTTILYHTQN